MTGEVSVMKDLIGCSLTSTPKSVRHYVGRINQLSQTFRES